MEEAEFPLWYPVELLQALDLSPLSKAVFPTVTGVSIDTRTLQPGDLFIALKGDVQDGHAYVQQAFEKGASVALVDAAHLDALPSNLPKDKMLSVDDTLNALWALGRAGRSRSKGNIVAVTGSVGKTTFKESLGTLLASRFSTHVSPLSYNNHWGVPLSLARMPRETAYGVFELGMNRPGEITNLTELVQPHVALITTIAPAHRAFFPSLEAIAEAKAEIFKGLTLDGVAILPYDHFLFNLLAEQAAIYTDTILTFGTQTGAGVRCVSQPQGNLTRFSVHLPNQPVVELDLALPGQIWTQMVGALAAVLVSLKLNLQDFEQAFKTLRPIKGRGSIHSFSLKQKNLTLIDESYNANPASMQAALETFGSQSIGGGKKVVVLGDMAELGDLELAYHLQLEPILQAQGIDKVFACGPLMGELFQQLPQHQKGQWAPTAKELLAPLKDVLEEGDAVLIKASNSMGLGALVASLLAENS